jgi:hypothetical protein
MYVYMHKHKIYNYIYNNILNYNILAHNARDS